jgi:hypothetical protein
LLRFGEAYAHIPAARNARVMQQARPSKSRGRRECRMHAAPAVSCAKLCKETHTSIQVQRRQSDIPCGDGLRLITCSPRRPGFDCLRRFAGSSPAKLDPSIGGSGPHAFARPRRCLRRRTSRAEHPHVHRIPLPTSVTIAIRPSCGGGMREDNHIFLKNGRRIFLRKGLDIVSD